jgi:hypothetical protein
MAKSKPLSAEQWNKNKARLLENSEGNTAEDWHKAIASMLEHVGPKLNKRTEEIAAMLAKATLRRNAVPQGHGVWFHALLDLFDMASPPADCEKPTEDEVMGAKEPGELRRELAERYDARALGDKLTAEKSTSEV